MKEQNDLFDLIKTLSPSEKRHFKLQTSTQKGDKKYLKLFDLISRASVYDEKKLRKALGSGITSNQFNFIRHYLYNALLSTLQQFHSRTMDVQIKDGLSQTGILFSKGLHEQALKIIQRIKKVAIEYDKHTDLISILQWEKKINSEIHGERQIEQRKEANFRIEQAYQSLKGELESENIRLTFSYLNNHYGKPRSEKHIKRYHDLLSHPLFEKLEKGDSIPLPTKLNLLRALTIYNLLMGNQTAIARYALQSLRIREEHSKIITENPFEYISDLNAVIVAHDHLGEEKAFFEYLNKLKSLPETYSSLNKNFRVKAFAFFIGAIAEMTFYLKQFNLKKGLSILPEINRQLPQYASEIPENARLYISYHSALICLGNDRFEDALDWFNKVLREFTVKVAPWAFHRIHLLLLVIYYEMGEDRLLEYQLVSAYRMLLRKNQLYKYEETIIRFIRKLPSIANENQIQALFADMKAGLLQAAEDPYEKGFCIWIIYWLEGREKNLSLQEVFAKKASEQNNLTASG